MMMRLYFGSYARRATTVAVGALAVSIVVHVMSLIIAVIATLPAPGTPEGTLANHIFFIPPPDRAPSNGGSHESVQYVAVAPSSLGAGLGPALMGEQKPVRHDEAPVTGASTPEDTTAKVAAPPPPREDSVFSVLEVDTAVARSANSAAPAYPGDLLKKGISGSVKARYVVDTTGFADTATFEVMRSSHPGFVTAVREALPLMRFSPAKMGPRKVRQLVEQEFTFKITPPAKPVAP